MVRGTRLLVAAVLSCCVTLGCAAPFDDEPVSDDAHFAAARVLETNDAGARPFAIVDKRAARLYVFDAAGRLLGATPALLGLAPGDTGIADIARRHPASLAPHERSTPAGRFESQPGHNDKGEAIVWVDYEASLAIHRLRPAPASERREARLASPVAADHRISFGCIVVPVAFYESVVAPTLGRLRGVVYVLPETRPVQSMFDSLEAALLAP